MPLALVFGLLSLVACGGGAPSGGGGGGVGGGGGGGGGGGDAPDFSLNVEVANVTLQQQGAYQIQSVDATAVNGFNGTIGLTVSGLPPGVTTIPASIPSFNPTGAVDGSAFQLAASSSAAVGTSTVTLTATSGTITHTSTFLVTVTAVAPFVIQTSPPSLTMTPATSANVQVSVTASSGTSPQLSLDVSPTSPVPNAGFYIYPAQGFLTVTTPRDFTVQAEVSAQPIQDLPIVVTASDNSGNSSVVVLPLTVSVPFSSSTAPTRSTFARTDQGPTGAVYDQGRKLLFVSVEVLNQVAVFSSVDGHRIASIPVMYPAGIDESADGNSVYVVSPFSSFISTIDPNLLQVVAQTSIPQNQAGFEVATLSNGEVLLLVATGATGTAPVYLWNPTAQTITAFGKSTQTMSRSADHSKVLLNGTSNSGSAAIYDVASNTFTNSDAVGGGYLAVSPDGSQIAAPALQNAPTVFYDSHFNQVGSISLDLSPLYGVLYSLDGTRAYVLGDDFFGAGNVVAAIDTQTFSLVGIVPGFAFGTGLPFGGQLVAPYAIDETNMLFGAASLGMGYLDASSAGSFNLPVPVASFLQPTLLSLTSPTPTQINTAGLSSEWTYSVYFGAPVASPLAQKGTNVSVQSATVLDVTAPAGTAAGPAIATLTRSDGFFQVLPDGASYGPTVLMVDANAGPASGGNSINIVGYGFDGSSVQVTIGGAQAAIQQVIAPEGTVFPTQTIALTTPAGNPGQADVTVTTPAGSTTVSGGFQYLNSAQIYPITGALDDIVYDQTRQRLYVSNQDHNRVEIFDLSSNAYLSPIPVGNQPTSLALTPDASMLAVLNSNDGSVSVIDPTKMQVTATYQVYASNNCGDVATVLSPAEPHRMLVDIVCISELDGGIINLINLDTGSLSCSGVTGCNGSSINFGSGVVAMASTPDGSKVFLADLYANKVGLLDLTANKLTTAPSGLLGDAAADADGNAFAGDFGIWSAQLIQTSIIAFERYAGSGSQSPENVIGEKLNPSGSLLFFPQVSGVDVFDVHTGRLALHVATPEGIPFITGALALDETGTKMFLISNSGITVAQLFQAPLSFASVTPATGAPGTQVTLRGSGFQSGATVTFGTSQVSSTYVDQNTLTATVPALSTGSVRITVTNPNGTAYSYDAAFSVQ